jgi:hypothetical protein
MIYIVIVIYFISITLIAKKYHNHRIMEEIFQRCNKDIKTNLHHHQKKYSEWHNWYVIFSKEKPVCAKCKKEVDFFGPIYFIGRGNDHFIHSICHGEVEIRRMVPEYRRYSGEYYETHPTKEQFDRMGTSFFGEFFVENISMWRGIPHPHIWRYNNDDRETRTCAICQVKHEKKHIGGRWRIGYDSFYRCKIKIKGNSYRMY